MAPMFGKVKALGVCNQEGNTAGWLWLEWAHTAGEKKQNVTLASLRLILRGAG